MAHQRTTTRRRSTFTVVYKATLQLRELYDPSRAHNWRILVAAALCHSAVYRARSTYRKLTCEEFIKIAPPSHTQTQEPRNCYATNKIKLCQNYYYCPPQGVLIVCIICIKVALMSFYQEDWRPAFNQPSLHFPLLRAAQWWRSMCVLYCIAYPPHSPNLIFLSATAETHESWVVYRAGR